jgi:Flp pilus assembly protein TadD
MKQKWISSFASVVIALGVVGCGHQTSPTQKQQAKQHWNGARAAVLASLAKGQYESGQFDKSQQTVNDGLKLNPENADLHLISAKLAIEQGQLEVADRELELTLRLQPGNPEAEYLNGIVYQRWSKPDMALECYIRASEKAPTEVAYLMARAEMLVALDRSPEALQLLQEKSTTFDQSAALRDAAGQLLVEQGRYPEAVATLRQACNLAQDDQLTREHLAMAYYLNQQYREALVQFERLLKDPANAKRGELWLAVGECQMHTGKPADARASFEKACAMSPSSPKVWMSHAKAALHLGDSRRAELSLNKALALDASSPEIHLMLGYLRLRQERMNDAMAEFRKANSLDRTDPVSLCMIGYVLEKSGKVDQAIQYYGQALKLKPDDELATKLMATVETGEK